MDTLLLGQMGTHALSVALRFLHSSLIRSTSPRADLLQQGRQGVPVLDIGRGDLDGDGQADGIDGEMTLSALDLS